MNKISERKFHRVKLKKPRAKKWTFWLLNKNINENRESIFSEMVQFLLKSPEKYLEYKHQIRLKKNLFSWINSDAISTQKIQNFME